MPGASEHAEETTECFHQTVDHTLYSLTTVVFTQQSIISVKYYIVWLFTKIGRIKPVCKVV